MAVPLTVAAAFLLINSHYGYWPTLGDLLGHPMPGQVSAATLRPRAGRGRPPPAATRATRRAAPDRSAARPIAPRLDPRPRPAARPGLAAAGAPPDAGWPDHEPDVDQPALDPIPTGQFAPCDIPATVVALRAPLGLRLPATRVLHARPEPSSAC